MANLDNTPIQVVSDTFVSADFQHSEGNTSLRQQRTSSHEIHTDEVANHSSHENSPDVADFETQDETGVVPESEIHHQTNSSDNSFRRSNQHAIQMSSDVSRQADSANIRVHSRQHATIDCDRNIQQGQTLPEDQLVATLRAYSNSRHAPTSRNYRTLSPNAARQIPLFSNKQVLVTQSQQNLQPANLFEPNHGPSLQLPDVEVTNMEVYEMWNDLPDLNLTFEACLDRARGLDFNPTAYCEMKDKVTQHTILMRQIQQKLRQALTQRFRILVDFDPDGPAQLVRHLKGLYRKAEFEIWRASELDSKPRDTQEFPAQRQLNLLFYVIAKLYPRIRQVGDDELEVWKASCYLTAMRWQVEIHAQWITDITNARKRKEPEAEEDEEEEEYDDDRKGSRRTTRKHRRANTAEVSEPNAPAKRRPGRPPGSKNKTPPRRRKKADGEKAAGSRARDTQTISPIASTARDYAATQRSSSSSLNMHRPGSRAYYPPALAAPSGIQLRSLNNPPAVTFQPAMPHLSSLQNIHAQQHAYLPTHSQFNPNYGMRHSSAERHAVSTANPTSPQSSPRVRVQLPPLKPEYTNLRSRRPTTQRDSVDNDEALAEKND